MFCILLLLQLRLVISITWISRQSGGDLFDGACDNCYSSYQGCYTKSSGCLSLPCCQCSMGYTVYQGSCRHGDFSHLLLSMIFYFSWYTENARENCLFFSFQYIHIYGKNRKCTGQSPNISSLTLNRFHILCWFSIANFEQVNAIQEIPKRGCADQIKPVFRSFCIVR